MMARGKTDENASTLATTATTATRDLPSRAEIESALDNTVRDLLKSDMRKALPGWQILWPLGVSFIHVGRATVPTLTEERAAALVEMAATNRHAFDAAAYIAGMNLAVGPLTDWAGLPESLHLFGGRVLTGEVERPPQKGRPRADDVPLRLWKYRLCRFVADRTRLSLTRNRDPSGPATFTACDAVAESLTRAGHHETQGQLASLCYDAGHADLRALANALGLIDFDRTK